MKLLIFPSLSLLLLLSCEQPREEITTSNPLTTALDLAVDEPARRYMQDPDHVGLAIGIWQNGTSHFYSYGETTFGNGFLPDEYSIYEIGSISKTFTAAMIVQFLSERNLTVDEPIFTLLPSDLPELSHEGQTILLKHLMNHTSGLPRMPGNIWRGVDLDNPFAHYDSTKVYEYLRSFKLKKTPGEEIEYSNIAPGISGLILERNTGLSYEENLLQRIAAPLGMQHTFVDDGAPGSWVQGYTAKGKATEAWDLAGFKGAGAIRSCVHDLLIYGKSQLGGAPSGLDSVFTVCHTPTVEGEGKGTAFEVGLGWILLKVNGKTCYYTTTAVPVVFQVPCMFARKPNRCSAC